MAYLRSFALALTARRLRAHGLILALCLWSVYIWNMATLGLFVSVPLAITGLVYLFGSSKRADTDAD